MLMVGLGFAIFFVTLMIFIRARYIYFQQNIVISEAMDLMKDETFLHKVATTQVLIVAHAKQSSEMMSMAVSGVVAVYALSFMGQGFASL